MIMISVAEYQELRAAAKIAQWALRRIAQLEKRLCKKKS